MNELPNLTLRQQAESEAQTELSDKRASEDLADIRELTRFAPFQRYFLRRIREKREIMERSIIEGVEPLLYQRWVSVIAMLRDIETMTDADRASAWKHLNPEAREMPRDEF